MNKHLDCFQLYIEYEVEIKKKESANRLTSTWYRIWSWSKKKRICWMIKKNQQIVWLQLYIEYEVEIKKKESANRLTSTWYRIWS